MLYKFQNDWNKNSKWLLTKKARQKIWKKNCVKTVLHCRILKACKTDMNGQEAKAKVQTTAKCIQFDAWARTGTKICNAKTD